MQPTRDIRNSHIWKATFFWTIITQEKTHILTLIWIRKSSLEDYRLILNMWRERQFIMPLYYSFQVKHSLLISQHFMGENRPIYISDKKYLIKHEKHYYTQNTDWNLEQNQTAFKNKTPTSKKKTQHFPSHLLSHLYPPLTLCTRTHSCRISSTISCKTCTIKSSTTKSLPHRLWGRVVWRSHGQPCVWTLQHCSH